MEFSLWNSTSHGFLLNVSPSLIPTDKEGGSNKFVLTTWIRYAVRPVDERSTVNIPVGQLPNYLWNCSSHWIEKSSYKCHSQNLLTHLMLSRQRNFDVLFTSHIPMRTALSSATLQGPAESSRTFALSSLLPTSNIPENGINLQRTTTALLVLQVDIDDLGWVVSLVSHCIPCETTTH